MRSIDWYGFRLGTRLGPKWGFFFVTTYFENDEYKVIKSEEALEGCFMTLRIEPKINKDNIDILIEDLPVLLYETLKSLLKQNREEKYKFIYQDYFIM